MSEAYSRKVYVGSVKFQISDSYSKVSERIFVGRITFKNFGRIGRIKVLLDGCEVKA